MWKVVHITQKIAQAEAMKELLEKEGFLVQIKEGSTSSFEIHVPASEAAEASEILYAHRCSQKSC